MFRPQIKTKSRLQAGFEFLELVYFATLRAVRGPYTNAVYGMVMNVVRATMVLAIFVMMFSVLGMRRFAIRGDFILYVMSGVFMFLTFTKSMGAVSGAEGPTSPMMMHAPMNPVVAVISAALAALYQQFFTTVIILFFYHAVMSPLHIHDIVGLLAMFLLAWFSGSAIGLIFYAAKPWNPDLVALLTMLFQRANMIASGKMFVANQASASVRSMFDWNPLYHTIDQGRGFAFLNYQPRYTSIEYPIYAALVCIMIGLMGQFFTRKYVSISWSRRR